MGHAVIAVVGAALLAWAISAWREKTRTGLTYGQWVLRSLFRFAFGVRFAGFDHSAILTVPALYLVSRQSRVDRLLLSTCLPIGTFHLDLSGDIDQVLTLLRSVLAGSARACLYVPKEVEASPETMARLDLVAAVVRQTGARVLPLFIRGTRLSLLSLWPKEKAPRSVLPQITIAAAPLPAAGETDVAVTADHLLDGMMLAKFRSANLSQTLFQALSTAARVNGMGRLILEDALGARLTYRQFLIGARVLAVRFVAMTREREPVGVLLPNANGTVLAITGLLSAGRPVAMLNYTAGPAAVMSAIGTAAVRLVLSSRAFVDKGDLQELIAHMRRNGTSVVFLEDLGKEIAPLEKFRAFLLSRRPVSRTRAEDIAVILFTSGSEGVPKGVALSSRNLVANAAQADCRVDISPADSLFNVLPFFHSFGLLGGMLLPLLYGIRLSLYPSPLHYKMIPATARKVAPTVMFGTDTFLNGYARAARDGDFDSVRMIVAGAEAVRRETCKVYAERFGALIVEGYGLTEAAPVVAVNSSTFFKEGSVGRLLPGMEMRLEPVDGIAGGGRMQIAGPNLMLGYLLAQKPGVLQPLPGRWHDTGDIVSVDARGFITIRGRARRFAKIAGEMVSLGAVEALAQQLWPEAQHAAVAVPDPRRGERIVLVSTHRRADRHDLVDHARRSGAAEIMLPDVIMEVEAIPVLGSGKIDYPGTQALALSRTGA